MKWSVAGAVSIRASRAKVGNPAHQVFIGMAETSDARWPGALMDDAQLSVCVTVVMPSPENGASRTIALTDMPLTKSCVCASVVDPAAAFHRLVSSPLHNGKDVARQRATA